MRTPSALEARDQLQKDAVDPVADALLVPLAFSGVLLALVQEEGFQVVAGHRVTGEVEVSVPQSFQDAQTTSSAT